MKEASSLLEKYRHGECTEEELQLLYAWFHELNKDEPNVLSEAELSEAMSDFDKVVNPHRKSVFSWRRLWSAAASILLIGVFSYYLYQATSESKVSDQEAVVLILEDGKEVNLSAAENGLLENELGLTIHKTQSGRLQYRYDKQSAVTGRDIQYHTLRTPIGQTYEIVLEDESVILLNAQSTLRFPISFNGLAKREVELSGEAFFNIAKRFKDKEETVKSPFVVHSKGQYVEVLGTAFNIKAYEDDAEWRTTLEHGVVQVHAEGSDISVLLNKPGDQGMRRGGELLKRNVHIGNELAWKRGKILLQDQDIYSIMKTIGRWYPIEVEYRGDFEGALFGGVINKDKSLEEVLKLIESTEEVKFLIEPAKGNAKERRVIVMK